MDEKRNIDRLFAEAASNFAPPAPEAAWQRLEASLAAKRKKRLLFWWIFSVAIVTGFSIFFLLSSIDFNSAPNELKTSTPKQQSNTLPNTQSKAVDNQNVALESQEGVDVRSSNTSAQIKTTPLVSSSRDYSPPAPSNQTLNMESHTNSPIPDETMMTKPETQNNIINSPNDVAQAIISQTSTEGKTDFQIDPVQPDTGFLLHDLQNDTTLLAKVNDTLNLAKSTPPIQELNNKKPLTPQFFISTFLGFGMSNGFSKVPQATTLTFANSENLKPDFNSSNSFNFGFNLDKWQISASISFFKIKSISSVSIPQQGLKYIQTENFGVSPMGYYSLENIDHIMESKNYTSIDYIRNFDQTRFNLSFSSFGFNVGRVMEIKRFQYLLYGGINSYSISRNLVEGGIKGQWYNWGEVNNLKMNMFGINIGGEAILKPKRSFFIGLKTDWKFILNSINESSEFSYFPFGFYVGPVAGFKF